MVLGKVIKLRAWIKITRLCGEKKNTNKRTSKQTKQNENNNNIAKQKLMNQLTFSFSLPKFFSFFFSFFDFLLDGPFVVLSVKTTTKWTWKSTDLSKVETIHVDKSLNLTWFPFKIRFVLKPCSCRPGEDLFFVFKKVSCLIHFHLRNS